MKPQMLEIMINVTSPYKWGQGWTGTHDEHDIMMEHLKGIVQALGHKEKLNDWGVPEGELGEDERSYMHPMSFAIYTNKGEERIKEIISIVKSLPHNLYSIECIKVFEKLPEWKTRVLDKFTEELA